jgi:hypothetical protein
MTKTLFKGLAVSGAAILAAAAFSPVVSAQTADASAGTTYQTNLAQQNKSNASGTASVTVNGNNVTVSVRASGLSANLAHPIHLHIGGNGVCPTPAADTNKDGYVDAKESEPGIGPMKVSLTTNGDTSVNSALAVDRMPKADAKGDLTYNRTFALPSGVAAADMAKASVDVHGISGLFNDKAKYDGDKKSELDNKVAFETTVPAACGKLTSNPTGGAATGVGSVSGIEAPALFVTGAVALLGAAAAGFFARKQMAGRQ